MSSRGFAKQGQTVSLILKSNFATEYNNWEVIKCFINLYFQSTLQTCNLNTFVLENDFEYSPFLLTKLEHYSTTLPAFAFSLHI